MDALTTNFIVTLFIATLTVTGILWMALALSGQATMNTINTPPVEPPDSANNDNDGFTWS